MPPTKATDSKKAALLNAMMKRWESQRWMKYRAVLHLHSEETADRLTSLLALHLLLDRMVTAVLSLRLLDPRTVKSLEDVEAAVSRLNFNNRIELAKAARLISDSCALDIKAVNKVRNDFAHSRSKTSKGRVNILPELESSEDFEQCMQTGERALDELLKHINDHFKPPA